jgi:hypothetical protein
MTSPSGHATKHANLSALSGNTAVVWDVTQYETIVIADVSEERIASIIRVTRIGELGTTITETGN